MRLIEQRLIGRDRFFPSQTRDEDPADIFVDLAEQSERWRESIQSASAELLTRWVAQFTSEDAERIPPLGELCYLVARVGSQQGLGPLRTLVADKRATGLVAPGEDLRLRALRALVGLLGAYGQSNRQEYRGVLIEALEEPRLALTALTGLVGLWPEETDTFLGMLPSSVQHGDLFDLALELTFTRRNQ